MDQFKVYRPVLSQVRDEYERALKYYSKFENGHGAIKTKLERIEQANSISTDEKVLQITKDLYIATYV